MSFQFVLIHFQYNLLILNLFVRISISTII